MRLPLRSLAIIVLAAALLALPGRAQMAMAPMKRIIMPDTPSNTRLVQAVTDGDLAGVQAALSSGASADTQAGWEGQSEMIPVELLAAQSFPDRHEKRRLIFHLLIQNMSKSSVTDPKIGTALLSAAVNMDDLEAVQQLVTLGCPMNGRSYHGAGILYESVERNVMAKNGVSPITAFLLDHGVPVNALDDDQATPLMIAAGEDKTDVVRALLAHGADPTLRDKHGWTALRWAALRGSEEAVSVLRDRSPMTLCEAAQFGELKRLRTSLEAGENPNTPDAQGNMPLMAAMKSGSLETARFLLDHGADVNAKRWSVVNGKRRDGMTALHLAALYGDVPLIGLLLDRGANINATAGQSVLPATPLFLAVRQAQTAAVALLLKRGASSNQSQGEAALDLAVREAGDGFVRPPLGGPHSHFLRGDAVYDARAQIIDLLLGAGVDIRTKNSHALYLAASSGQAGLIELFLSKGADVNGRGAVGSVGSSSAGQTALMGAIEAWSGAYGDEELATNGTISGPNIKEIHEAEQFARSAVILLLAHGADVNLPDARGTTPLMQCVSDGLPTLTTLLLAHGANVGLADPAGRTALMQAAGDDDPALVALLLAHHANVNHHDKQGRTALMLAVDDGSNDSFRAERAEEDPMPPRFSDEPTSPISQKDLPNPDGHPQTVRLLLKHGANVNAVAADGTTALSRAQKQKFGVVVALLTQAGARR